MHTNQNTQRLWIYLAVAFGIPWGAALVFSLSGAATDNPLQAVGIVNTIFIATPWLANIAARLFTREGWGNLMLRPNLGRGWPYYLAAWLLPLLATVVGGAVFYLLMPQYFDPSLSGVLKLAGMPSAAVDPWLILFSLTLSLVFISSLINAVASMGEEFGWRAYLLPRLMERFSQDGPAAARKAALLTGVIHGVWHWPLLLMAASLTPGFTPFALLTYVVLTSALSILLSWAALRSGSVWPAALGHGAGNAVSILPGLLLTGAASPLLGPDPTGLLGGLGFTLIALVLFFNRAAWVGREKVDVAEVAETASA